MPGIVIGAAGLERTQTWKTPSSTGEDEERPRSATSNTKKAPRAFVDTLPAGKRRGRPPKKTAAIMGVGPANGAFDGVSESNGSDREASHDLDNVEDEVDPANVRGAATTATPGSVRGVGGYILIPSRAGSAASSQRKAGPVATAQPHPIKKPSLTPISSASVSQEPEDLLSGFNPRRIKEGRTKEDHTNSQYSTTSASPNIAPRKRGRPPKSAAAHKSIGSLLAYVESDEWVRDSNASKSPCPEEPLREPETNTAAEKVNENGEEPPAQQSEQQTTVLPHPLPQPQPQPASNLPETPTRRPVEIIEISSSSDSSDDEDDVRFGPTEEQRRDPRYAEIIRSAEAIRLAEARHRETRENVEMIRRNIGVNSQGQLSAARPPNAPRPLNASRPSNAACPSNAPRPLDAPRPRTPPRHKTPTPGPANPSPAHRIVAHKMAPLLTEGATKETAICLDDDDEYDEEKEYHFSKVIDLKVVDGKMHYLVQWHEDPCPPEEYSCCAGRRRQRPWRGTRRGSSVIGRLAEHNPLVFLLVWHFLLYSPVACPARGLLKSLFLLQLDGGYIYLSSGGFLLARSASSYTLAALFHLLKWAALLLLAVIRRICSARISSFQGRYQSDLLYNNSVDTLAAFE
ncbi:hypothetical protein BC567DRAFT_253332, partial [Phyllosticta citribraziliensis]